MKRTNLNILIFFFIYLSISISTIHLLTDDIIGMRHDWVSPVYPDQIEDHIDKEFNTWSEANSFSYIRRNLLYFKIFQGVIGFSTGFNPTLLSISTIFLILTLSGISMYLLSKQLSSSELCGFIAGLFFMLNPVVFNKIVAGHTGFLFSYALAPLIILFFLLSKKKNYTDWKYIILAGLFFGLAFAQHQFIILIPSVILLIILFKWIEKSKIQPKELIHLFVLTIIGFGMHLFWIIPYTLFSGLEFNRIGPITYHALKNAPLTWQSMIMTGWSQPYDYTRLINDGILDPIIYFFLFFILLISLTSLIFKNKIKNKIIYLTLFLIGVFLTTGINNPAGDFFIYAYINIPFFRIFRDPYTFTFFIAFSISVLLAFILKDIKVKIYKRIKDHKKIVFYSINIAIIFLIIISSYPMLNGNYSNQLQTFSFSKDYEQVYERISNKDSLSRIFYFPSLQPINIVGNEFAGRDNMILYPAKPSFPQNVDRLDRFNRFHMFTILNLRQGFNISNLLKITSTEYLINRENHQSWYYKYVPGNEELWGKETYKESLNQFLLDYSSSSLNVYQLDYSPFIKIVKPYYCTGNLNILSSIPNNKLNETSILFTGDISKEEIDSLNMSIITNEGKFNEEYELSLSESTEIIRLKTEETNFKNGWAYDDNVWRLYPVIAADIFYNGFQTVLTSSYNAELNNTFKLINAGDYRVFIRLYQNEDGGKIKVSLDNKEYVIETNNKKNSYIFKDLGIISLNKGFHQLLIENIEGLNAVSYLMFTPIIEYNKFLQEYSQNNPNKEIIYVFETENDFYVKNTGINYLHNIDGEQVIDLESVRNIWKEINIDKKDDYLIAVKGSGEFDFSIQNNNYEFNSENFSYNYYGPVLLDEQIYNLSFSSIEKSTVSSFYFENDNDKWGKPTNFFEKEYDSESYEGSFSLKLTTTSEKSPSWSWVRSEAINVTSGNKYRLITHMKYTNVKQSHIPIEGFDNSTGTWQQLTQLPSGNDGTSVNWKEFDIILTIPENITHLRFTLNAGWVLNNETGEAITWFDDFRIYPVNKGVIDKIWLYSSEKMKNISELFTSIDTGKVQNIEKISQTEYRVTINSTEPYLLSFSEAYDSRWIAELSIDKETLTYGSIPLYNSINGFWIGETGNYELIIRYEPQLFFDIGLYLSYTVILSCFISIMYMIVKNYDFREIKRCLKEKLQKR